MIICTMIMRKLCATADRYSEVQGMGRAKANLCECKQTKERRDVSHQILGVSYSFDHGGGGVCTVRRYGAGFGGRPRSNGRHESRRLRRCRRGAQPDE